MHINFAVELMEMQIAGDRFFLYEHPAWAASWSCESVKRLMAYPDVQKVIADQCRHGLKVQSGRYKGDPVRKPTGFVSNCRHLLNKLAKRCKGSGGLCSDGRQHATCSSTTARDAQVYGRQLCKAMLEGMQAQLKELGMLQSGILGIQAAAAEWQADELLAADRPREGFSGKFRDDLTGQILNDVLVVWWPRPGPRS